jgi:hypothetical protein
MSPQGEWLCYRPRAFARGRDYQVFSDKRAIPAQLTDAFTVVAEGMLKAHDEAGEATWQYVPLGEVVALCRCGEADLAGAQSLVVWALLLPPAYVRSGRFGLGRLPDLFPGRELGPELPASLDLVRYGVSTPAGPEASGLISRYLETGGVKVNVEPSRALRLFTSVVEALAPTDRLQVSFATAPGSARALAVDAAAPPPEEVPPSVEGLVRLELWRFTRFRLAESEQQNASLRERTAGWLCALLRSHDLRTSYAGLLNEVRTHLNTRLQDVAYGYLRRALETRLSELAAPDAAHALTALVEDRLLTGDAGVPPMWLPRIALQNRCLADLSPALLERVLQADVLPMILESVQQAPVVSRVGNLARAVEGRQARDARGLRQACAPIIRELLRQVAGTQDALRDDRTLARAFAVLLLRDYAAHAARS